MAQRLLKCLRDVVDVVGHTAQEVATRVLVEVLEWQDVDLVLDARTELVDNALRGRVEDEALCPPEQGGADVDADDPEQDAVEVREVDPVGRRG